MDSPYEEKWYSCLITDQETRIEPDWSKVPEERRELVRTRWLARTPIIPEEWKLWGPQISLYQRTPGITVVVIEV